MLLFASIVKVHAHSKMIAGTFSVLLVSVRLQQHFHCLLINLSQL